MSETTENSTTETKPAETETVDVAALQAEVEKWKHFSRQNEDKFKDANSELEKLRQASMTDAEKAIEAAKAAARAEAQDEVTKLKLENAAIKAGVPENLLGVLDVNKLVVNGEIQSDLLTSLAAPTTPQFTKTASDLGLGAQTSSGAGQVTREQLARMSTEEINAAREAGKLNDIMTGKA